MQLDVGWEVNSDSGLELLNRMGIFWDGMDGMKELLLLSYQAPSNPCSMHAPAPLLVGYADFPLLGNTVSAVCGA